MRPRPILLPLVGAVIQAIYQTESIASSDSINPYLAIFASFDVVYIFQLPLSKSAMPLVLASGSTMTMAGAPTCVTYRDLTSAVGPSPKG